MRGVASRGFWRFSFSGSGGFWVGAAGSRSPEASGLEKGPGEKKEMWVKGCHDGGMGEGNFDSERAIY